MRGGPVAKNVDAYIKAAPDTVQPKLAQLRKIVRTLAPKAEEGISYGMPYYKLNGALVGFAAFKNHIGFFPGAIVGQFKKELAGFKTSKGAVQLALDKALPVTLIKTLIKASMKRNSEKAH
jgi:uncharacterized protein YdhG (YjbR/CyaY superfamily)